MSKESKKISSAPMTIDDAFQTALRKVSDRQYNEADKLCTAIIQAVPHHVEAINLLGIIAQKLSRHDLALIQFEKAIALNANLAPLFHNMGISLFQLGQREKAVASIKKALEIDPGNGKITAYLNKIITIQESQTFHQEQQAQEIFQSALSHHRSNRLHKAVDEYDRVLTVQPENRAALNNKGLALASLDRLDDAVDCYRKAIAIHADYAEAHNNLGVALKQQNRLEEAVDHHRKAVTIKPDYAEAHNNLGVVLDKLCRYEEALKSYHKAIELSPHFVEAHNNRGVVLEKQHRFSEAVICFNKAISLKSDFADAYINLGSVLKVLGRIEEAASCFRTVLALNKYPSEGYNNLGVLSLEQGQYAESIGYFQKALEFEPKSVVTHVNLGRIFKELGEVGKAASHFQHAFHNKTSPEMDCDLRDDSPGTDSFFVELTNVCNFHCSFCPSDDQTRKTGEMSLDLVRKIFHELSGKRLTDRVSLHLMGEPTLYKRLLEALQLADECHLKVDLITNGSTLSRELITSLLDRLSGKLIISLQTPTEASFTRRRTRMPWKKYIARIHNLLTEYVTRTHRGAYPRSLIEIRIMRTPGNGRDEDNIENPEIRGQLLDWIDQIISLETRNQTPPYPREPVDEFVERSLRESNPHYMLSSGVKLKFWTEFAFPDAGTSHDDESVGSRGNRFCLKPFTELGILWNGDCVPCCVDYDGTISLGNVNSDSIESILTGKGAVALRRSFLDKKDLHPLCRDCLN